MVKFAFKSGPHALSLQLVVLALFLYVQAAAASGGSIAGMVETDDGTPLPYATVRLLDVPYGTLTGEDGRYRLNGVPAAVYVLEVSMLGYETTIDSAIQVDAGERTSLDVVLKLSPITLSEMVVTPGRFAIMKRDPVVRQTLSKEDIRSIPQLGDDIFRAIKRVPGVSSNDFSARFTVRGGEHEEVLVLLDGLELYEPFHLKDVFGGAISIVDVATIAGIDMMTGGFPSQYGNHMSGVFDISTLTPGPQTQTSLGISFMNARFMSQGQYDDGKGNWLVSARRGYLDIVLGIVDDESNFTPIYWDVLAKTEYRLDERHTLSAHILHASDHLDIVEDDEELVSAYGNSYGWLRLRSALGDRLTAQSLVSVGLVTRERSGEEFDLFSIWTGTELLDIKRSRFDLDEKRDFAVLGAKQDWNMEVSDRHLISWGFDLKRLSSDYDYFNRKLRFEIDESGGVVGVQDTLQGEQKPDGTEIGLFAGSRFRLIEPLTFEGGLRFDRISYTDDADLSPRLSAVYTLGSRTVLRGGWGYYRQAQDVSDLDVPFGDAIFYRSQRAEHRVVGLEHGFRSGVHLRLEAYQKKLEDIRPRYENLSKGVLFFPELKETTVFLEPERGESRGLELYLRRDTGGKFSWWTSYALARVEERIAGVDVPKNQDQRHTVYIDLNYRPNRKWRIGLAWQYHSGWPYSERIFLPTEKPPGEFPFEKSFGPRNAARLPAYHRMDLRINRQFKLGGGRGSVFLDIFNLYDRGNVQARFPEARWRGPGFPVEFDGTFDEEWLPLLPSIGARWEI